MQQPDNELEVTSLGDDWGDFDVVIKQLETEEAPTESTESSALSTETVSSEAFEGLLSVVFTIAEQATSIISGIDFAFDEKGKNEVIKAAIPVLSKHGGELLGWFGDYVEEATLLLAVLALVYTSKRHITELKAYKAEQEKRDAEKAKATAKAA
ncbi:MULTISPECIES: hypothetical protein [Vibrio]|uniref:Uncharacterized protein n=1 Tax=Vibrio ordalii FS-238 TaxID=617133 RepID=A0A853R7X4_9VIBR|nr:MULTISPECIES: hypothetical protein [Vibrio]AQM20522.1 hypothetical protein PN51_12325 [Vibrio anguillarum]AUB88962.1 hypothetical protein CKY00_17200 [Vibrio anguillarum]AUB92402.1 hypothetical protein CKX99_17215 [Vibrio anguillarum]AUB95837.1 hypothetical protein CK210_17200 [Vibrio anguillarum]AUB99258.1 hypothetical protein CK209_17130 [Vibrio anguillarum]